MTSILFIDDEPEYILPQCEALGDYGFEVFKASSPDEARQLLSKVKYDLVILDLLMQLSNTVAISDDEGETLSGAELHQWIREEKGITNMPIVFVSVIRDGKTREELRAREEKYHWKFRYLTKPVLTSDVINEVQEALKEAVSHAQP